MDITPRGFLKQIERKLQCNFGLIHYHLTVTYLAKLRKQLISNGQGFQTLMPEPKKR